MSVVITGANAKIFKKETINLIVGWAYTNCRIFIFFFNDKKKLNQMWIPTHLWHKKPPILVILWRKNEIIREKFGTKSTF